MQGMNDMTTARPASALRSPGALVGSALLVAVLGAGAGWMLRGPAPASTAAPVAAAPQDVSGTGSSAGAPVYTPGGAAVGAALLAPQDTPADEVEKSPHPTPVQQHAPAPQPVHRSVARAPAAPAPAPVAAPAHPVAQAPAVQVCRTCGVVESVQAVRQEGPAQGIGAVAGGVLGGVLGNQVGGGTGRKVATVLGAVGGGFAGHEVEKRVRSETVYEVRVRMEDGSVRRFSQSQPIAAGTRVVDEGGRLRVQ
jgi:outer membrane lipoprotein SlyB